MGVLAPSERLWMLRTWNLPSASPDAPTCRRWRLCDPGTKTRGSPRATWPLPTSGKVQTRKAEPLGYERPREHSAEFRCKPPSRSATAPSRPVVVPIYTWTQTSLLPSGNSSRRPDAWASYHTESDFCAPLHLPHPSNILFFFFYRLLGTYTCTYTRLHITETRLYKAHSPDQEEGYIYDQDAKSKDSHLNISVCYIQMFTLYHWKGEFI